MQEVKRIGVMSAAKLMALAGVLFGLIVGVLIAVFSSAIPGAAEVPGGFIYGLGLLSIIIFPIFYGVIYFISGALGALIYNLLAGWIGGIKIELGLKK